MPRSLIIVVALVAAGAAPCLAHVKLVASTPADGAQLPAPPAAVELRFDGRVQVRFSEVDVQDADGVSVRSSDPLAAGGDELVLSATLKPALPPGAYRVRWRIVSADGHKQSGSFTFTVLPPR